MKKVLVLLVLVVAGWLAWQHFRTPTELKGRVVAPQARVMHASAGQRFAVADRLEDDVWTVVVFVDHSSPDSQRYARELEVAVRQEQESVRLVVADLRGFTSPMATQHGITQVPTAWLYRGYAQRSTDADYIHHVVTGGDES